MKNLCATTAPMHARRRRAGSSSPRPGGSRPRGLATTLFTAPPPNPVLTTRHGLLYNCHCLDLLSRTRNETVDLFFADPPFNAGKDYGEAVDGRKINDALEPDEYFRWCRLWLDEAVRVLKPGGALYLYHVPKWNMRLGTYLETRGLWIGNWITVGINGQLPVRGKLLQHGYSLLYFTKGRPKTFHRVLTPLRRCRHCNGYVKDYGGKLRRFERRGGTCLSDVWDDVTAVRHRPYRSGPRGPLNQMSTKIVQRALAISTRRGDVVVDVFGGSGTTYAVAESMGRRWVGCEYGSCEAIRHRLSTDDVCLHPCDDIVRS